jgi:hypothetical protein
MKRRLALLLSLAMLAPTAASAKHHASASGSTAGSPNIVCPAGDATVWVNSKSNVYHYKGSSFYGTTKHGHYACESAARSSGGHAAKGESAGGPSAMRPSSSSHMVHSPMTAPAGMHPMVTHATPTPATHHFSFFHHKTATPAPKPH